MKKTILGHVVKRLQKVGVSPASAEEPLSSRVPFDLRLDASFDRLATHLSLEERKETRAMAKE